MSDQTKREELYGLIERTFDDVGIVYEAVTDAVIAAGYTNAPVRYPDRDELAFELFRADNSRAPRALCVDDFSKQKAEQGEQFYVYSMADAALELFAKVNR